jgi:hypothetical protein
VQTDYARAAAGFDEQFRDALMAEIIGTVAECSVLTDAPLPAIRTGETADALVRAGAFPPQLIKLTARDPMRGAELADRVDDRSYRRASRPEAGAQAFEDVAIRQALEFRMSE